ncbi:MAG: acetate--CoA ligase family protein [Hyphomicrobiaceae bacterium]
MRRTIDTASLDPLFKPTSVAVVGASADAAKIGGRPVDYLKRLGFGGAVLPVNPKSAEIQGLKAYPSVSALPEAVDLAILSVPAALVLPAVEEAAAKGVRSLIVFSSGFAEVDAAGRAAQQRIVDIALDTGMRVLGPNCMGLVNVSAGVYASFSPVIAMGQARPGNIAIVSQSGAFGAFAYTLARERGLGLSKWVASGNESDVDVADCIAWLAGDAETKVILAYIEGAKDGRRLMAALEMARAAGKPVIVTKVGRTEIGAHAAASHTAALAGEDAVYDAVLRQCGAYRARTVEEFFDVGYAAAVAGLPKGGNIGLLTVSGGVGVLMADDAVEHGLAVTEMPAEAQAGIRRLVPFAATRNPLDITGQVANDETLLDRALDIMLGTGCYDMLATFNAASGLSAERGAHMLGLAKHIRSRYPRLPVAFCSVFRPELRAALEASGCMAFEDPSRMIRALAGIARLAAAQADAAGMRRDDEGDRPGRLPEIPEGPANEVEALAALACAGVPVVETTLCATADEAAAAARKISAPVVVKVVSRDILHKSDIGGVRLGLRDEAAVRSAFDEIMANAGRHVAGAKIDGVLVAPMISGGVECILGVQQDPAFGPVVMFGLGGVLVEVLKDVSFRAAPFDRAEALAMIREIRGARVLEGVRGAPPADVEALADALAALSRLAAGAPALVSLDINPFLVRTRGSGAVALDAVLIGREHQTNQE